VGKKKRFVHLHLHTEYSLLDGLSKIKPLMEHIKENNMDSVAITDHGTMYGAIEFYKKAKELKLKAIIGLEAYITNVDHKIRGERSKIKNYHLTLLAKNFEGYQNLIKITSTAHLEGFYYRPRIDHKTLKKYSKGIICLSGCAASELSQAIIEGDTKNINKTLSWHQDVFGEDYYLEIQRHKHDKYLPKAPDQIIKEELAKMAANEKKINDEIIKLSRQHGIPIVATNDAHYIKPQDAVAQDALVCISTGKNIAETKRLRFLDTPTFHTATPEEMFDLFSDLPEALENTVKVAEKTNLEITIGKFFFPKINLPKGVSAKKELIRKSNEGLKKYYKKVTKEAQKRLDYELEVITSKGYSTYFLIFQDMAQWAHKRLIPINVRGSVAGSLVSYVLGITTIDPIRFQIPFERFLNPYRPSAPDIDLDIADDKRGEMIAYLTRKYGKEKVAQICTFGRMLARGSVRDVARVLGYPYEVGDRISKLIPIGSQGFPMTIQRAFEDSPELKRLYDTDPDTKKILDLAQQIEGNARHISVHAGGVVISPGPLTDFVPLQLDTSNEKKLITQYEMHACEDVGLVKLDILGIKNLSILREAVAQVKESTGKTIKLGNIPLDDKKTFKMLSKGKTMGVFQLSGSGMTRYLVELQPEKIEDIMMMIALFRPGPMSNIDEYIARKRGKKKITYYHPKMEKYLDKSLGVLVYQDDLLYTALEVAGYNWEEVDKFRKAVGKKIPEEMAKQHSIFVKGCMKNSQMTKEEAEGLWDLFEPFQGYGFNKAHSASYGMVAYQTAYMKANYPVEYMTALLTAESADPEKISQAVGECRKMGIKVLPPDINESDIHFTMVKDKDSLEGKAIRFGLEAIKNVGTAAIQAILDARRKGDFTSFSDFCNRVDARKVNKKVVESLIKVGAMNAFGGRAALLAIMDEVRTRARPTNSNGQQDLFSSQSDKKTTVSQAIHQISSSVAEFSDEELEDLERQLLGFSLTAKPLDQALGNLILHRTHKISDLSPEVIEDKQEIKIAGRITELRVVITKRSGAEMAFGKIEDETGSMSIVIFPKLYKDNKNLLIELNSILFSGKFDTRDDNPSILVDTLETEEMLKNKKAVVKLTIPENTNKKTLIKLGQLLRSHKGNQGVILHFDKKNKDLKLPFTVNWSKVLSKKVFNLLNNPQA